MMKKYIAKIISFICIVSILFGMFNIVTYADDGNFVLLSISGYDDEGKERIVHNNVFYLKNNVLYAPIQIFEKYTMYNYDEENNAFVRVGQKYKNANSKVVFDYNKSKMDVYFSSYQKQSYNLDYFSYGGTYFFSLHEMAAYLKASVVFKDSDTISILNSGVSLSDALYNFEPLTSCLDHDDLRDDIFAGNEFLAKQAYILGYFGETVFSFKLSNLMGNYGDYKTYLEILQSAVTNNEPYEQLMNNENLLSDVLGVTDELYNEVYKKSMTVYSLASNSVTTMFEDYKAVNSFGDDSPFDNFFPDEQLEIDKLNAISGYIDTADKFINTVDFFHKFYTVNQDNKDAIELFASPNNQDTRAKALSETASLYGNDIVESVATQLSNEIINELLKSSAGKAANYFISGANKVKLATSIVNTVFKAAGFDLSDNSGYDVMLASQLKRYILSNIEEDTEKLNTEADCIKMRLTLILGMLIDIESYKMGNKLADKYDCSGIYDDEIENANKRLALLYLAKNSKKYDSVGGTKKIAEQNKKQIQKLNLNSSIVDSKTADKYLISMGDYIEAAVELIYNFPKYGMTLSDTSMSIELIDLDGNHVPEILYCSHMGASRIPLLGGVYSFDGKQYNEATIKLDSQNAFTDFPIVPKIADANSLVFVSYLIDNESLEEYTDIPNFASFWYYNTTGVSEFNFSNNVLTSSVLVDYSLLRDKIDSYSVADEDREKAWESYKEKVKEFNSKYVLAEDYKYTIVSALGTGFINSEELSVQEQLDLYHETVNKQFAEYIVEQYENGVKEIDYYDYEQNS